MALAAAVAAVWTGASWHYGLLPVPLLRELARLAAVEVARVVYASDQLDAGRLYAAYWRGDPAGATTAAALGSWRQPALLDAGVQILSVRFAPLPQPDLPFVVDDPSSAHLERLRRRSPLESVAAGGSDPYERVLRVLGWLGAQWRHGTDPVPGGRLVCDPVALIEAGQAGSAFSCGPTARVLVQAATALGWPARKVDLSKRGYFIDHSVAEIWSDRLSKWIMADADFNVVVESDGVPLSSWEICHRGRALEASGRLEIRHVGPRKAGIDYEQDYLALFRYVQIDLRNDWRTRPLRRGSPAAGDASTWWTARPGLGAVLTSKRRVDDPTRFDWPVNGVTMRALRSERRPEGGSRLALSLASYSPYFEAFQVAVDDGAWRAGDALRELDLEPGEHRLRARVTTRNGDSGPVSWVTLRVN